MCIQFDWNWTVNLSILFSTTVERLGEGRVSQNVALEIHALLNGLLTQGILELNKSQTSFPPAYNLSIFSKR